MITHVLAFYLLLHPVKRRAVVSGAAVAEAAEASR